MVGVAQLVEPQTVTLVVEGSSPFIHPILIVILFVDLFVLRNHNCIQSNGLSLAY